jgi:predicted nicotinamide N-methyase
MLMMPTDTPPRRRLPAHLSWLREPDTALLPAEADPDDHTWAYSWPAGLRMAAELPTLLPLAGARCCDLGCGLGALGFTALGAGASWVQFADGAAGSVAWIAAAIAPNALAARAHATRHDWGTPLPNSPWPLILGGDILYRPASFPALIATIAASLAPGGLCLLSDPRSVLEPDLPTLAEAHGLSWTPARRPTDYTLIRLTH